MSSLFEVWENVPAVANSGSSTNFQVGQTVNSGQQFTGVNAVAINSNVTTDWIQVSKYNAILWMFQYVYGAGTSVTFNLEMSPDKTLVFPVPLSSLSISGGAFTVNGNTSTTATFPVASANENFSLAMDRLNIDYVRLKNIIAGGSPTTSDKITVTARMKRFVG